MRRFLGEHYLSLDDQGRMYVPKTFVRVLEREDTDYREREGSKIRTVCLATENRPFLEFYSAAAFDEVAEKIGQLPRGSRERTVLERVFFSASIELTLDRNRRLTIPVTVRFRRSLNLLERIIAVGHGDTFQLWKQRDWAKHVEGQLDWIDDLEGFDPIALLEENLAGPNE